MPNPNEVKNSQTFTMTKVIYNHNDFSIALGYTLNEKNIHLAMRINGDADGVGFPRAFNHSLWFPIEKKLTKSILKGLSKYQNNLTHEELLEINQAIKELTEID